MNKEEIHKLQMGLRYWFNKKQEAEKQLHILEQRLEEAYHD